MSGRTQEYGIGHLLGIEKEALAVVKIMDKNHFSVICHLYDMTVGQKKPRACSIVVKYVRPRLEPFLQGKSATFRKIFGTLVPAGEKACKTARLGLKS